MKINHLKLTKDQFLRDHLKIPSYYVDTDGIDKKDQINLKHKNFFLYSKIKKSKVKNIRIIKSLGFKFIDEELIFEGKIYKDSLDSHDCNLAKKSDEKKLHKLCDRELTNSRFHQDLRINLKAVKNLKKEWISNFFKKKRGDYLIINKKKDKILGFLLLKKKAQKVYIIDLIAVDGNYKGKGIAKSMVKFFVNNVINKSITIIAGTQGKNKEAISFYKKIGLNLKNKNEIFHYLK